MSVEFSVEDLMRLARDRSSEGRSALVTTVSDLYFNKSRDLTEREIALMTEILRQLIHDVELSIRRALAERLAEQPDADRGLLSALANDEIEVAHPILVGSPLLEDSELIEVIQNRTKEHQLAIAMRATVNEPVSDALVQQGYESVIKALLENEGARIAQETMAQIVNRARTAVDIQAPLLGRTDLGADLAKRMFWWVSAALRQHILDNFPVEVEALEGELEETVRDLIRETRREAEREAERRRTLVERLHRAAALGPKLMIQVLREGEVRLFEAMFARLAQLDDALIKRILYEPGGKGLAVTCKGIGIEKPDFASLFLLSRQGRPGDKVVDPSELSGALSVYDFVDRETSARVLERWRLDPDYAAAIRDIESRLEAKRSATFS